MNKYITYFIIICGVAAISLTCHSSSRTKKNNNIRKPNSMYECLIPDTYYIHKFDTNDKEITITEPGVRKVTLSIFGDSAIYEAYLYECIADTIKNREISSDGFMPYKNIFGSVHVTNTLIEFTGVLTERQTQYLRSEKNIRLRDSIQNYWQKHQKVFNAFLRPLIPRATEDTIWHEIGTNNYFSKAKTL